MKSIFWDHLNLSFLIFQHVLNRKDLHIVEVLSEGHQTYSFSGNSGSSMILTVEKKNPNKFDWLYLIIRNEVLQDIDLSLT